MPSGNDHPAASADDRAQRSPASPAGKVPVLHDGAMTIWESIAILEYLAGTTPEAGCGPRPGPPRRRRADDLGGDARGLVPLRTAHDTNLRAGDVRSRTHSRRGADIAGSPRMWETAARASANGGPFLFGAVQQRGRDVRAGGHPLRHVRRRTARCGARLRRCDPRAATDAGLVRGGKGRALVDGRERRGLEAGSSPGRALDPLRSAAARAGYRVSRPRARGPVTRAAIIGP